MRFSSQEKTDLEGMTFREFFQVAMTADHI